MLTVDFSTTVWSLSCPLPSSHCKISWWYGHRGTNEAGSQQRRQQQRQLFPKLREARSSAGSPPRSTAERRGGAGASRTGRSRTAQHRAAGTAVSASLKAGSRLSSGLGRNPQLELHTVRSAGGRERRRRSAQTPGEDPPQRLLTSCRDVPHLWNVKSQALIP